jgi:hypothetical protein
MNKLTKKGILIISNSSDEEDYLASTRQDITSALRNDIEFDEGISLRDLFRIFEPIKDFISDYSLIKFDAYAEELNKPIDWSKKEGCPIDHIEVHWMGEYFEEYNDFRTSVDAHGVDSSVPVEDHGKWKEGDEQSASRFWAIDAQAMNNIADLPIKLNTKFGISKLESGEYIIEKKWDRGFTLLEAIDALFYEISFFGLPEDRDAFLGMLGERMEEVKNMTEEEKKIKLIPMEDVLKRLKDIADEDDDGDI